MEKKKSVKVNFIYNTIFQVFIYIIPLITTPYVSRVLGAEHIGQYSYAMSIVTYFTLVATLGTATHGQRTVAYNRNDKWKLSATFWNTLAFRAITTIIASVLYIVYLCFYSYPFSLLEIIVIFNIFNVVIDVTWFFQGLEDFKQTVLRGLAVKIGGLIGIFLFVKSPDDTWKYAMILLGATMLGNMSLWRHIPKLVYKPIVIHPFREIKDIIQVFLPTIATQVYTVLDKSMIGWITKSDYANGCYEQSEKIVRVLLIIVSSVSTVMLPRVANLYSIQDKVGIKKYIYKSYRVVFCLAIPFMFGLAAISSVFMPLYLGPGYDMSVKLLIIFTWLLMAVGMASVTGLAYLVPTKQQNIYTFSVTIAAVVNFFMNLFLIPKIGAYGAAVASIVAESVGSILQLLYCILTKQLEIKEVFRPSWKYAVGGLVMFVCLELIKSRISSSFISLCILVLTGIIIYGGVLIILRDDLVIGTINKYFRPVLKRKE